MEHCYSVQGQSDKHIDFGTHEVADISAPTFHYGIIWFRWSLSSVASLHSGTIKYWVLCIWRGFLLSMFRNKDYQYTTMCIIHILEIQSMMYIKCFFLMYQHFTTAYIMRSWDNPQACIIQENATTDYLSSLQWKMCYLFVCSVWKTAFPPSTSPHQDFIDFSNSNLLLSHHHLNNLLC